MIINNSRHVHVIYNPIQKQQSFNTLIYSIKNTCYNYLLWNKKKIFVYLIE